MFCWGSKHWKVWKFFGSLGFQINFRASLFKIVIMSMVALMLVRRVAFMASPTCSASLPMSTMASSVTLKRDALKGRKLTLTSTSTKSVTSLAPKPELSPKKDFDFHFLEPVITQSPSVLDFTRSLENAGPVSFQVTFLANWNFNWKLLLSSLKMLAHPEVVFRFILACY